MYSTEPPVIRPLHLRVKDKHAAWLSSLAREVNFVFNYCNDLSIKVFERERRFLSGFDFWPFLKGATRGECGLNLPVQAVQEISEEYARPNASTVIWSRSWPVRSARATDPVPERSTPRSQIGAKTFCTN
jgi:hypothetical protein